MLDNLSMISLEEFQENRRRRLALMIKTVGPAELARLTKISEAQLYQMSKGKGKQKRPVDDDKARSIEKAASYTVGWLDQFGDRAHEIPKADDRWTRPSNSGPALINAEWLRVCILGTMDALGHQAMTTHVAKFAAHAYKDCQRTDTIPSRKGVADYVNTLLEELEDEGRVMGASEKKGG